MTAEIGQIIDGKYKLVRLLGTGGMGAVYEGENTRIRRRVAIKMLHANVSNQAESVTRFEREAQAAGRIGSEHICEVLDLGTLEDATRYMVMEYLEGETLSGRIKRLGRLHPLQAVPLICQALDGLGAAHVAGIIHRDLKPDNMWIVPQKGGIKDFVKILDFGVSKFSQIGGEEMNTTRAGAVVGTPYYMSPEQARGMSEIDNRTDLYAMGVLLYQATTGQVPYQAETFNELLFKIVLEVAPPPQTYVPDLDADFAGIIMKAMAREPAQRFQSSAEFRDALVAYQAARGNVPIPTTQPRPIPVGNGGTQMLEMGAMPMQTNPQPWGSASSSGQGPAMTPSWSGQPNPGGPVPPGPMLTSNSWGHASSPGPAPKAKSSVGLFLAIGGAVVVLGGAAVLAVALRTGDQQPQGEARGTATQPAAAAAPPPAPASAAPAAAPSPAPSPSAQPSASASEAASATPEPTTQARAAAPHPYRPPARFQPRSQPAAASPPPAAAPQPPAAASPPKPPPKPALPGSDLGY